MKNDDLLPANKPIAISISENFDQKPFILSAEAVQKIREITLSRSPGELVFDVRYSDGTELHDVGFERVMNDENPEWRSISKLEWGICLSFCA
jgi:hypothetical protein